MYVFGYPNQIYTYVFEISEFVVSTHSAVQWLYVGC